MTQSWVRDGGAAATPSVPQASTAAGTQRGMCTAGTCADSRASPLALAPSAKPAATSLPECTPTITRDTATAAARL